MAVVVDAVLCLELLNVPERSLGMRAGDAVALRDDVDGLLTVVD
jgi:hypothetical protein